MVGRSKAVDVCVLFLVLLGFGCLPRWTGFLPHYWKAFLRMDEGGFELEGGFLGRTFGISLCCWYLDHILLSTQQIYRILLSICLRLLLDLWTVYSLVKSAAWILLSTR